MRSAVSASSPPGVGGRAILHRIALETKDDGPYRALYAAHHGSPTRGCSMQRDRSRPIPDTTVFDGRVSRRGYRLNKLAGSLNIPENRAAFKVDEEGYMARYDLTEAERGLIRARDFAGLIEAGLNVYMMLKIGACTGHPIYRMGAQMRGETYEQFLATRNMRGAV